MRVVFLGTPDFAVPSLRILLERSYQVCAVFTQPDRPSGRGQKLHPSPIKKFALENSIPIFQPEKISGGDYRLLLDSLKPDFLAVVAFGQILPGWLLQAARIAPVNVHFSLLPRYRGASPVAWTILNGDKSTGVTTILMEEKLDAGPILLQRETPVSPVITTGELTSELAAVGAELLVQTLDGLQNKTIKPVLQDESRVSWARRITKEMAVISWNKHAVEIHNQIRALNPWPAAYGIFRNEPIKIWRSLPEDRLADSVQPPGTILGQSPNGIRVQCGEGAVLDLMELQLPGKNRVAAREFANGVHISIGDTFQG